MERLFFVGDIDKKDIVEAMRTAEKVKGNDIHRIYLHPEGNVLKFIVRKRMPEGSVVNVVIHERPIKDSELWDVERVHDHYFSTEQINGFDYCLNAEMLQNVSDIFGIAYMSKRTWLEFLPFLPPSNSCSCKVK